MKPPLTTTTHKKSWLRFLPLGTMLTLIALLGWTTYFLYNYFYQTISQVKVVTILRSQIALHQVDLPLYQEIVAALEAKKKFDPEVLKTVNDPFKPLPINKDIAPSLEEVNKIK